MSTTLEDLLDAYIRFSRSIDEHERVHGRSCNHPCTHHTVGVAYDGECGGIDEIRNMSDASDEKPVCIRDFAKLIRDIFGDDVELTITDADGNVVCGGSNDVTDLDDDKDATSEYCRCGCHRRAHDDTHRTDMSNVNYIPSWDCKAVSDEPEDTMARAIDNLQLEYGDIILVRTKQDDGGVALVPGVLTDWNVTTEDDGDVESLSVEFVRISRGKSAGDMMTAVCDEDDIDAGEIINIDIDGTFGAEAEMVRGLADTVVEIVDLVYPNDGLSATGIDDCPNVSRMLTSTLIENLHVLAEAIARYQ